MKYRRGWWGGEKGGQTYPNEHKDKYRDKVICSRDRVLIGQTEEIHDGGAHAEYTLDFVTRRLVRIDGPDLGLSRGPRGFLQVDLYQGQEDAQIPRHFLVAFRILNKSLLTRTERKKQSRKKKKMC